MLRAFEFGIIAFCCFIVLEQFFQKAWYMATWTSFSNSFTRVFGLLELILGLFVSVLEFVVNIKLVLSTLRSIQVQQQKRSSLDGETGNNKIFSLLHTSKQEYSKYLRLKMIIYLIVLLLLDLTVVGGFVVVGALYISTDWAGPVSGITLAILSTHLFLSFKFLDFLLQGLLEIKRLNPVVEVPEKPRNNHSPMKQKPACAWNSTEIHQNHSSTGFDAIPGSDQVSNSFESYQSSRQESSYDEQATGSLNLSSTPVVTDALSVCIYGESGLLVVPGTVGGGVNGGSDAFSYNIPSVGSSRFSSTKGSPI